MQSTIKVSIEVPLSKTILSLSAMKCQFVHGIQRRMGVYVRDTIRMATIVIRNIEKSNKVVTRLRSVSIDKIRIAAVKSISRFNPLRRVARRVVRIVSSPKVARIKMNSSPFEPLQSPQN